MLAEVVLNLPSVSFFAPKTLTFLFFALAALNVFLFQRSARMGSQNGRKGDDWRGSEVWRVGDLISTITFGVLALLCVVTSLIFLYHSVSWNS